MSSSSGSSLRIQTAAQRIVIQVLRPEPGGNQSLQRLVGKEVGEKMQSPAMKAQSVEDHGHESLTMRDMMGRSLG
jgi:hypothetical protein